MASTPSRPRAHAYVACLLRPGRQVWPCATCGLVRVREARKLPSGRIAGMLKQGVRVGALAPTCVNRLRRMSSQPRSLTPLARVRACVAETQCGFSRTRTRACRHHLCEGFPYRTRVRATYPAVFGATCPARMRTPGDPALRVHELRSLVWRRGEPVENTGPRCYRICYRTR